MFNPFLFEISAPHGVKGIRRAVRRLALAAVMATAVGAIGFGASSPAMAQAEPTLKQIYETAAAGKLPEAQIMVQQVLVAHPKSAKAHFVQAEMFSRQGNLPRAREALAEADKLEPGLPFVKPEVVQVLRKQLEARPSAAAGGTKALNAPQSRTESATALDTTTPAESSLPLVLLLALGVPAVAAAVYFGLKKKFSPPAATGFRNAAADNNNNSYSTGTSAMPTAATGGAGSGLSGPQTFGTGGAPAPSPYGQNYAQPGQAGYGQPGYGQGQPGQQPGGGMMSGMGGRVAGGLATGLAVGAGVMAAQAIGRSFSGNDQAGHADKVAANAGNNPNAANPGSLAGDAGDPTGGGNRDMGGQNFGFNDAAGNSWDDGGSADTFSADAGGGDWDT